MTVIKDWPGIKARKGHAGAQVSVVGRGRNTYLWWGDAQGRCSGYVGGDKTLRKLANYILDALDPKGRATRAEKKRGRK